jgi:hypothetical protein
MSILIILSLLLLILHYVIAFDPTQLPANLGCGVTFPVNNYTRHMLASNTTAPNDISTASVNILGYEAYSGPVKWPHNYAKDGGYHSFIPYCYLDVSHRTIISTKFISATRKWAKTMDGDMSQTTGQGVDFWELFDNDMVPMYCHTPGNKHWNDKLPLSTVCVTFDGKLGGSAQATIGKQDHLPGRVTYMSFIQLGPRASVPTIMHELGHVMGKSML